MNGSRTVPAAILIALVVLSTPSCREVSRGAADLERFAAAELSPDQADAPAVILLEEDRWEITGRNEAHRRYRIVKKILESGHPEEGTFALPEDSFRKIISMEARALFPDGSVTIVAQDEIQRFPDFADYVLYSDQYSYVARIRGVRSGTIVEFAAEQRFENLVLLPRVVFQDNLPIVERIFTISYPVDMKLNIVSRNMGIEPVVTENPSRDSIEYRWEAHDIPPIELEDHAPPLEPRLPSVRVIVADTQNLGEKIDLSSWEGVVRWYEALSKKSMTAGSRVKRLVENLDLQSRTERERARRIYHHVRENTRYVAIYLGLGGYRPHDAEQTIECKYGDCKDQAAALVASLREAGIEAHPVLVRTTDRGHITDPAPTPGYFNHVIAVATVDGADLFLDPTCGSCSYGTLPFGDQGAHSLIIRRGETDVVFLPVEQGQENRLEASTAISIESDGTASVSDTIRAKGFFSTRLRGTFTYRAGRTNEEIARDLFLSAHPFVTVTDASLEGESARRDTMKILMRYSIPEFLGSQRTSFVSPLLRPINIPRPDKRDRVLPVVLGERMTLARHLAFRLPNGRRLQTVDDSLTIDNDYFTYSARWSVAGTELRFDRLYRLKKGVAPTGDLDRLIGEIDAIERFERSKVVVEKEKPH